MKYLEYLLHIIVTVLNRYRKGLICHNYVIHRQVFINTGKFVEVCNSVLVLWSMSLKLKKLIKEEK